MHEWALAESIIRAAEEYASRNGLQRISLLRVYLGELQAIDHEILGFALDNLRREAGVAIDRIEIVEEEAVFRCNRCGYEWRLSDTDLPEEAREAIHFVPEAVHAYMACPRCGSRDYVVVSGRGVRIEVDLEG